MVLIALETIVNFVLDIVGQSVQRNKYKNR